MTIRFPIMLTATDASGTVLGQKIALAKGPYSMDETIYSVHLRLTELFRDVLYYTVGEADYRLALSRAKELFSPAEQKENDGNH